MAEHEIIVTAIETGNAAEAEVEMTRHLENAQVKDAIPDGRERRRFCGPRPPARERRARRRATGRRTNKIPAKAPETE